ncbi:MAG TPA: MarC family protein [Planctomycetota bacterium]|nr:MarC family protein [Planctomycetota bacterium]
MLSTLLIVQIFVLLNPLSSAPLLVALHRRDPKANIRRIAMSAALSAFLVALAIALTGQWLFQLFGIGPDSFRVAGGIVVLLLGLETIRGDTSEPSSPKTFDNVVALLATPILTGPATMSFITLQVAEFGMVHVILNLIVAFIGVAAVMLLLTAMIARLNSQLIGIISRILGLFLTAMAVELMAKGLAGLIHAANAK